MTYGCFIYIYVPEDIRLDELQSVELEKMFETEGGNTDVDPNDVLQSTKEDGRHVFKFEGCYDEGSIGRDASGDFELNSLIMMPAKMDSGPFGLKICKDEDCG